MDGSGTRNRSSGAALLSGNTDLNVLGGEGHSSSSSVMMHSGEPNVAEGEGCSRGDGETDASGTCCDDIAEATGCAGEAGWLNGRDDAKSMCMSDAGAGGDTLGTAELRKAVKG